MSQHILEIEHEGRDYSVEVEVEWEEIDDSFDHDWGGRTQTEHLSHFEPSEWEVLSCVDLETGEDIEPAHVVGLAKAIKWAVEDLESPE